MLDYRETKPCGRCAALQACDCEFARRELQATVRHVNDIAAIAGRRLPDAEVVFDCQTYFPRPEREAP